MKEIFLVGAKHGVMVGGLFGAEHYEVSPPDDFRKVVGGEANSRIAIELYPGATTEGPLTETGEVNERYWHRQENTKGHYLFLEMAKVLLTDGHEVLEIDDENLNRVKMSAARRLRHIGDKRYRLASRSCDLPWSDERRQGHARTLISYLDTTLREDKMFERLAEVEPDVAIMGQAHADLLALDKVLQARLGLKVGEYQHINPNMWLYDGARIPYGTILSSEFRDPSIVGLVLDVERNNVERELARRRYNAFRIGRVMGIHDLEPDFLGRFYLSGFAAESLFELSLTDRSGDEFQGVIKDVLGDATVSGSITEESIQFTKVYDVRKSAPNAANVPLVYSAALDTQSGEYQGRYTSDPGVSSGYVFRMRPYAKDVIKSLDY